MEQESRIIILRGNSGSGKTTVARMLQQKLGHGTLVISQDVVRREMLYVRDEPGNQAVGLMIDLINYGRKNCPTVILEGILYAKYYGKLFEAVCDAYGDQVYAYYFDLPFEETVRRHGTKPNAEEFGEDEMRLWWREKDSIGIVPEHLIGADMKAEEAADWIRQELVSRH